MSCLSAFCFPAFALCCWRRPAVLLEGGSPVLVVAPAVPVVTATAVPQVVAGPVILGQCRGDRKGRKERGNPV